MGDEQRFLIWESLDGTHCWGEWNRRGTMFANAGRGYADREAAKDKVLSLVQRQASLQFADGRLGYPENVVAYDLMANRVLAPQAFKERCALLADENYEMARELLDEGHEAYVVHYCPDIQDYRPEAGRYVVGGIYTDEDGDVVIDLEDGSRLPIFDGENLNSCVRSVCRATQEV